MANNTTPGNRAGHKIEPKGSLVVIEVIAKIVGADIYLLQEHIKTDPSKKSGAYHVTGTELERMITGYETGDWAHPL